MSDIPTDPAAAGGQQQPSEEELRAYLDRVREMPAEQLLTDMFNALINAAQVKAGRPDGRLLIDIVTAMTEQSRDRIDGELTSQLDEALTQLRSAQVQAEQQAAGSAPADDQATAPGPEDDQGGAPDEGDDASGGLWVPGR